MYYLTPTNYIYIYRDRGFADPFEPSFGGYEVFVYFICLCLWKMCFRSFLAPITLSEKPRRPLQAWAFSLRMRPEQAGTVLQASFHSILRTGMNVLRASFGCKPTACLQRIFMDHRLGHVPKHYALLGLFAYCSDGFHGNGRGLCWLVDMLF